MDGRMLVALGVMAFPLVGCGDSTERKIETAMRESGARDADVEISDQGMRLSSEDERGRTTVQFSGEEGGSLPEGFPADAPVFPGATVAFSVSSEAEGMAVTLGCSRAAKEVYDYYGKQVAEQGWTIDQDMDLGDGYLLHATKEQRELSVSITGDGDECAVILTVTLG